MKAATKDYLLSKISRFFYSAPISFSILSSNAEVALSFLLRQMRCSYKQSVFLWYKPRTTKITLDGIFRGKVTIMLKIKKFSKPF